MTKLLFLRLKDLNVIHGSHGLISQCFHGAFLSFASTLRTMKKVAKILLESCCVPQDKG